MRRPYHFHRYLKTRNLFLRVWTRTRKWSLLLHALQSTYRPGRGFPTLRRERPTQCQLQPNTPLLYWYILPGRQGSPTDATKQQRQGIDGISTSWYELTPGNRMAGSRTFPGKGCRWSHRSLRSYVETSRFRSAEKISDHLRSLPRPLFRICTNLLYP